MASIVGDKYRNAVNTQTGGWAVTDKIFGYMNQAVGIYNKAKTGYVYDGYTYKLPKDASQYPDIGLFGMPKPWGGVLLGGGVIIVALIIYNASK
jgi:hypothetical protein